jgi:DNA-binding transcriptional LysR family regulator
MLSISLKQYSYLVAAAEHGNLTAAASALHVSQPAISVAIAAMEAHFGQAILVRRHGQGVSLTAFGRDVVQQARQVLSHAAQAERLRDDTGPLRGQIVFGSYLDLAAFYVPSLLRGFARKHPGVTIALRTVDFDTVSPQLESGAIDLALSYGLGLGPSIERIVLMEQLPCAIVAADHPLARRRSVSLRQLARYPLVLADEPLSREHIVALFSAAGVEIAATLQAGTFEFLRGLVANGHGVAVVYSRPKSDRSYDGKKLVELAITDSLPAHPILLARLQGASLNRAARAFTDFMIASFGVASSQAGRS